MYLARSLIVMSSLAACTASSPATAPRSPEPTPTPTCGSDAGSSALGFLHGVVVDPSTNEPLPGVTVIATSPTLPTTQSAITDEAGAYRLAVAPGTVAVTFYTLDITIQRTDVPVRAGCDTPLFQRIDTATLTRGETIQI